MYANFIKHRVSCSVMAVCIKLNTGGETCLVHRWAGRMFLQIILMVLMRY